MNAQTVNSDARINPVKAIRARCLDCSGGSSKEVERCQVRNCALYPFRMGKNPFRAKRKMSEEQKAAAAARLRAARDKRSA